MRILTRYILKEVLSHAFLGGALFTFVLFMPQLPQLLEMMVRNSSSAGTVAEIFLLTLPNMFTVTIPMAVLVGILLGLSRLAADSEITAMRASGIGVWRFVGVVAIVSVSAWGFSLFNTLYISPAAYAKALNLQSALVNGQASYEVQPRVFYEDFKNYVLYVQNVVSRSGAASWQHIFLADLSDPNAPKITTGSTATVVSEKDQTAIMRMHDGAEHEYGASDPDHYTVSTFATTDLPLALSSPEDVHIGHSDAPILATATHDLVAKTKTKDGQLYLIELHKRFAYPAACLVLMLVGVPLGITSKRGGKSAGFVISILLVFTYYLLSSTGTALARQHKLPAGLGVWMANILFSGCGFVLLRQMSQGGAALAAITSIGNLFKTAKKQEEPSGQHHEERHPRARHTRGRFPLILDEYVLKEFLSTFTMVLVTFVMLMLFFTFFELLGDIIRNRTPLVTVGAYLANLAPSMIYTITPLSVLIAVLVVFGVLNRSSELTAMKASGISLYRIVLPVMFIAMILSASLFTFDELYLPQANRRQEALRNVIKGRPAQTVQHPGQRWIFGLDAPGKPPHIFYYQYFDADRDTFGNITIYEFNPDNFSISKRIFASSVHWEPELNKWVFEHGWQRSFDGAEISDYKPFDVSTFPEIQEQPQYFKKDERLYSEMSFHELSHYIHDLRQSGFDTMRLRVQLNRKLAYPLITLVMAILAVPFALTAGKRGSLAGVSIAIGVAIAYFVISGMFEAMGNVNMLPAFLAAWSPDVIFALAGGYLLLRSST
ncbi:LPS export ABC transporter permease LptG [Silvibacterium acidisoli]|uniref:LPS export ABC transporter permease LptG n=1 Tax=Acidobacteriaceae bacterium ZG23-2 TaxID=2883246 RepID=UPI00406CEAF2